MEDTDSHISHDSLKVDPPSPKRFGGQALFSYFSPFSYSTRWILLRLTYGGRALFSYFSPFTSRELLFGAGSVINKAMASKRLFISDAVCVFPVGHNLNSINAFTALFARHFEKIIPLVSREMPQNLAVPLHTDYAYQYLYETHLHAAALE